MTSALEAAGVEILRNAGRTLLIRGVPINVAGVDDPWRGIADFDQALAELHPAAPTLRLCHQPDLFPAAARRGVALTLSGHYHGGQIQLAFPGFSLSRAHLISRFVEGAVSLGAIAALCQPWDRRNRSSYRIKCAARNHPAPLDLNQST